MMKLGPWCGECAKSNAIPINLLELPGIEMTAYVMVQESDNSSIVGAPIVMLGDYLSAVTWVNM